VLEGLRNLKEILAVKHPNPKCTVEQANEWTVEANWEGARWLINRKDSTAKEGSNVMGEAGMKLRWERMKAVAGQVPGSLAFIHTTVMRPQWEKLNEFVVQWEICCECGQLRKYDWIQWVDVVCRWSKGANLQYVVDSSQSLHSWGNQLRRSSWVEYFQAVQEITMN
jgi:hypothetical protein